MREHERVPPAGFSCVSDEVIMRVSVGETSGSADAPTGPLEFVLMTLQNSVSGCSRKRLRQYNMYLRVERKAPSGI